MTGWGWLEGLGPDQLGVVNLQTGGLPHRLVNSGQQRSLTQGRRSAQASAAS